jgi:hypothetical protein
MKYFILLLFVLIAASSQAQITFEHSYYYYPPGYAGIRPNSFELDRMDSATWKYVLFNDVDSLLIYNLDHTLDKLILVPNPSRQNLFFFWIAKNLFTLDNSYCYMVSTNGIPGHITVYNENGNVQFGCENCWLNNIINTNEGPKMLIDYYRSDSLIQTSVFSLPGKLPTGGIARSSVSSPTIISNNVLPTSAYPNPSNGQIHIEYKLPDGVPTGEIVITNIQGTEVKRYKVGSVFNDILIEKSDLPSGSYFYKLVTEKGESEARRIIILK